jgi:hypothetical protein
MPATPGPVGVATFVAMKFCGYSIAGRFLAKEYERPVSLKWKVGAVRTAIGIAMGVAYFAVWNYFLSPHYSGLTWFLGLVPVRLLEWGLLLRIFFEPTVLRSTSSWQFSTIGTAWSFVLDAVGIGAALVVPGGIWIGC